MPKVIHAAAKPIGQREIGIDELEPNPHNPRVLFDRLPLADLESSIKLAGILVPLTVYREKKHNRFVILDGQRRWICAKNIGLKTVPVNEVVEPSLVQNIVTMFQIHKLRQDWELMPTALKIQLLMEEVKDRNDARLAALTGLNEFVIGRCKKLLSFHKRFQDMMLDPDPAKRIKSDFFIELYPVVHDRDVTSLNWFSENRFVDQMLVKYQKEPRTIKAVTDFRLVKQHIVNARRIKKIGDFSKKLKTFAEEPSRTIDTLEIQAASVHAQAKTIVKKIGSLEKLLEDLNTDQYYGEEALWGAVKRLILVLERKLSQADKRQP